MPPTPQRRTLVGLAVAAAALPALLTPAALSSTKTTKKTATTKKAAATKKTATTKKAAATTKAGVTAITAATATTAPPITVASGAARSGTVRLGFFANVTHAPALVGVEKRFFADALGPDVTLQTSIFNAGPSAVEALFSGGLDIAYIGPNPAINAFQRSGGKAVRIVSGAASGGAFLVVKPSISSVEDLKGKKIATPQLGNTQDVALRHWLGEKGYKTTVEGGGDVSIVPQENAQTLETFRSGQIDGAWVPEPWATRLILEGGAKVLLDERNLWPNQSFTTTLVLARAKFLEERPDLVERVLAGHLAAIDYIARNPTKAQEAANEQIGRITGRKLSTATIANSWVNLTFTADPEVRTIKASAAHAKEVGLLDDDKVNGIEDLTLLNKLLAANKRAKIAA